VLRRHQWLPPSINPRFTSLLRRFDNTTEAFRFKTVTAEVMRVSQLGVAGSTVWFLQRICIATVASSQQGFQNTLDQFSAVYNHARLKISTKKTEVLCVKRNGHCLLEPPQRGLKLLIDRLRNLLVMSLRQTFRPKRALTSICMEVTFKCRFLWRFPFSFLWSPLLTCGGRSNVTTTCVSRNPRQGMLQMSSNTLQQVKKFKYLRVVLTSDGRRKK